MREQKICDREDLDEVYSLLNSPWEVWRKVMPRATGVSSKNYKNNGWMRRKYGV